MRSGWQRGFATITVTVLTVVLVVLDINDGPVRSWSAAHPFTTATVAGILVLGITVLIVDQVVRSLEFSGLAKYTFGLAQMFNAFYHRYPILAEERADRKQWRAAGVAYVRDQLTRALDLMGIEVPARM